MIRRFALASAILIAAGSTAPAMAQTATSNLTVTATVGNVCTISSASISFGNYDPVTAHHGTTGIDLDGSGSVTTTCTNGLAATITLGQGLAPATGSTPAAPLRQLANGANVIGYSLFRDSGRTTAWGNTSVTGLGVTGTGSALTSTIYGRIPRGQAAAAGIYNDTVVATVSF